MIGCCPFPGPGSWQRQQPTSLGRSWHRMVKLNPWFTWGMSLPVAEYTWCEMCFQMWGIHHINWFFSDISDSPGYDQAWSCPKVCSILFPSFQLSKSREVFTSCLCCTSSARWFRGAPTTDDSPMIGEVTSEVTKLRCFFNRETYRGGRILFLVCNSQLGRFKSISFLFDHLKLWFMLIKQLV